MLLHTTNLQTTSNIVVTSLIAGLSTYIYFVAFESTLGWTLGKKVLGLRVLGPAGAPKPKLRQSAVRNSFTLLSCIPSSAPWSQSSPTS